MIIGVEERELIYRFTVRCNRAENARIERMAKAKGMTANALVQQHFGTLLEKKPVESSPATPAVAVDIREDQSIPDAVMAWMVKNMNPRGEVSVNAKMISDSLGIEPVKYYKTASRLTLSKQIKLIRKGGQGALSVYQVLRAF